MEVGRDLLHDIIYRFKGFLVRKLVNCQLRTTQKPRSRCNVLKIESLKKLKRQALPVVIFCALNYPYDLSQKNTM